MTTTTMCLTVFLGCLLLITLTMPSGAMYVPQGQKRQESGFRPEDISSMALSRGQHVPRSEHEPGLFDLLISALREPEGNDESLKRGKQFKATKPCFWSLVSCY